MRQRRLNYKPPRNEMPAPGDPRLKAYEEQREMDRQALILIEAGASIQNAYQQVSGYDVGGIVSSDAVATIHHDCVLPQILTERLKRSLDPPIQGQTVNITINMPVTDCDAEAVKRFPVAARGKQQMPLIP